MTAYWQRMVPRIGVELLRVAQAKGLPTVLDPDGLNFPERIPLLIGHSGEVPGHAFDVRGRW